MSFLDALLGRAKPKKPNLDALFALPSAAVTLEAEGGLRPSGHAAAVFKPASGHTFAAVRTELDQLLKLFAEESSSTLGEEQDRYGYQWITIADPDFGDLVTTVHAINSTLADHGFGNQLLCSIFGFGPEAGGAGVYLVYLYKRGTFYPFAPLADEQRDVQLELRVRGLVSKELPIEEDLGRWFPLWGVPISQPGPP